MGQLPLTGCEGRSTCPNRIKLISSRATRKANHKLTPESTCACAVLGVLSGGLLATGTVLAHGPSNCSAWPLRRHLQQMPAHWQVSSNRQLNGLPAGPLSFEPAGMKSQRPEKPKGAQAGIEQVE